MGVSDIVVLSREFGSTIARALLIEAWFRFFVVEMDDYFVAQILIVVHLVWLWLTLNKIYVVILLSEMSERRKLFVCVGVRVICLLVALDRSDPIYPVLSSVVKFN